jgi:serine/threonine protein kinase
MQTTGHRFCFRCGFVASAGEEICPEDGSRLSSIAADPYVGKTLADKYEVLELLGRGGMSIVYKVRHLFMQRFEALKMLRSELISDSDALQRFQQESKAVATLRHVNIVRVLDFGLLGDDVPFLTMEYLEGKDLGEILKEEGILLPERVVPLFAQICDGLFHAHQRGVIHRDIKPSNILISRGPNGDELPVIVDFGIAKLLDSNGSTVSKLTGTGQVFGSPLYMSPEQCLSKRADERTDIYALGCVLYQVLTGVAPIQGNTPVETMMRQMQEIPRAFMFVKPDHTVPQALEICVMKALSKDPESRYRNMNEFRKALLKAGGLTVTDLPGANLDTESGAFAENGPVATGKSQSAPLVKMPSASRSSNREVPTTGTRGFRSNSTTGSGNIDMTEAEAEALLSDPELSAVSGKQSATGSNSETPARKPIIFMAVAILVLGLIVGGAILLMPASRHSDEQMHEGGPADYQSAFDRRYRSSSETGVARDETGADPKIASIAKGETELDAPPSQGPPPHQFASENLLSGDAPAAVALPASAFGNLDFEGWVYQDNGWRNLAVRSPWEDSTGYLYAITPNQSADESVKSVADSVAEQLQNGNVNAGAAKIKRVENIGTQSNLAVFVQEITYKNPKTGRTFKGAVIYRNVDGNVWALQVVPGKNFPPDKLEDFLTERIYRLLHTP